MARLSDTSTTAARREVNSQDPIKTRADALGDAAAAAKRSAEGLVEQEQGRQRALAGVAGAGGLLALACGAAGVMEVGPPLLLLGLAGVAALVPTVHALAGATARSKRLEDAAYERGFAQALAHHARRLGDAVGATDTRNLPLGAGAVITAQLDVLYRDLDRAKQRLEAAGATPGVKAPVRLNDTVVPHQRDTFVTGSDGRRYPVRIVDVSQSGVSVKGQLPPLIGGEEVQVGGRRARIAKTSPGEAALQFLHPILPSELTQRLVL